MGKKYKLGKKHSTFNLYRVVSLRDFSYVKEGDVGGWVETEDNLSQEGNCWIANEAVVTNKARVSGEALVSEGAKVSDKAEVGDSAHVRGNAQILENAKIRGSAYVYGKVCVQGEALVTHNASIRGCALVYEDTLIGEHADVYGYAQIYGNAHVLGYAKIKDNVKVYQEARVKGRMAFFGDTVVKGYPDGSEQENEYIVYTQGISQDALKKSSSNLSSIVAKMSPSIPFPIGSVVRFKSGGPDMTVTKVIDENTRKCSWFDWGSNPIKFEFHIKTLLAVTVEEG